ncbi:LysM peptidoglycan-binding domain-containing protein [Flavobacterium sp. J27]|uniref:LysM peptidoglycan-binding domain-containing protein n=1 Tax=Flavobacterium sp. J27 TaxID=2060419 RepID=UPI0010304430|nr:LysM peptidoglycan-binding domain-containing protein [Flavobacterium sp. J27]
MRYFWILFACTNLLFAQEIKTKKYKVQPQETLYSISKKLNISIEDIKKNNPTLAENNLSIGQEILIPLSAEEVKKGTSKNNTSHTVQPQETLYGIARMYNVSVQDLEDLNKYDLKDGLQIGQVIAIPTRKKTIDGKSRIINEETVFHKVKAGETKYSVSKLYNISIKQLELQNPEIVNRFAVGTVLAVNKNGITSQDISNELLLALAEKDAAIEKSKAQNAKIEDLEDRLIVQQQMNQKIIKMNSVAVDLKEIDDSKGSSVDKLKLILQSNKTIQDVLTTKLDSLVSTMYEDLEKLKNSNIVDVDEYRKMQKETQANRIETSKLIIQLKRDLNESRKNYVALMNKVQRVNVAQDQELKRRSKSMAEIEAQNKAEQEQIEKIKALHADSDKTNESLFFKMATIEKEKEYIITKRIEKATFYSAAAREYDDRLALQKLIRYQNNIKKEKNIVDQPEKQVTLEEIRAKIKASNFSNEKLPAIERMTNLKQVEDGFYIVLKVTKSQTERDDFARELSDKGELKTSFFYDISTFTYCIYTEKFKWFEEALFAIKTKESLPLYENAKIVEVKLE